MLPRYLDLHEVDLLYNDYIRVMTCMHERLRATHNLFITRFLDEKLRKEHGLQADTQRLILPGEEDTCIGEDGTCDFAKMFDNVTLAKTSSPITANHQEPICPSNNQDEETKQT